MVRCVHRALLLVFLLLALPARAVLFVSTADPEHNTQPPSGDLAASGWQWEGEWNSFLGTVIAPDFFVTARHVGGSIGQVFNFRGVPYKTIAAYEDAPSDLRLWRVCGRFPDHAPLYEGTGEKGSMIVVVGRGTQRGAPVYSPTNPAELRGWKPGASDGRWRWGTNIVVEIVKVEDEPWATDYLAMDFDLQGGGDEAHLTYGDSGGAVFIQDNGIWKLAGINYAVDGNFNTSTNGLGFNASLFDARGFFVGKSGNWELIPSDTPSIPSAFYSSRISGKIDWIREILALPGPSAEVPTLLSAAVPDGPYTPIPLESADIAAQQITVVLPAQNRFFRLQSTCPRKVVSVTISGETLVFRYE